MTDFFDPGALEYSRMARELRAGRVPEPAPAFEPDAPPLFEEPDIMPPAVLQEFDAGPTASTGPLLPIVLESRGTVAPLVSLGLFLALFSTERALTRRWLWYRERTGTLHPVWRRATFAAGGCLAALLVANVARKGGGRGVSGFVFDTARLATLGLYGRAG